MANSTERLLSLKNEIEQAKLDKASIKGALDQNLSRLKTEFQCRSLDQAIEKKEQLLQRREEIQTKKEQIVQTLEQNYVW